MRVIRHSAFTKHPASRVHRSPLCLTYTASGRRHITNASDGAVREEDIQRLADVPLQKLTLEGLSRYGNPPLSNEALFESANFALSVLPVRLAHRIRALRNLPFIVVSNPHVSQIHTNYIHSLSTFIPHIGSTIDTKDKHDTLMEVLEGLIQRHSNTIPILARGFLETRKYINPLAVTSFLDQHLRARIGTRMLAEQHIALCRTTQDLANQSSTSSHEDQTAYIGIIDTALQPASIVRHCEMFVSEICELNYGVRPSVVIDGDLDATIVHIPVHLEYVITELLKNSFRATCEQGNEQHPVEVTIAPIPDPQTSTSSASESRKANTIRTPTPGVTIRIRDRGGGISPENYKNLWNYGFTTFKENETSGTTSSANAMDALNVISGTNPNASTLAGLGYGLPLGRAYAEYFGGSIAVQSLWGWGTDVYLTLRGSSAVGPASVESS